MWRCLELIADVHLPINDHCPELKESLHATTLVQPANIITMPRLRVRVSSPTSAYPPTQLQPVNSPTPTPLKTPHFDGEVSVWVKDFTGDEKKGDGHEYFESDGRGSMTYAIVIRGASEPLL